MLLELIFTELLAEFDTPVLLLLLFWPYTTVASNKKSAKTTRPRMLYYHQLNSTLYIHHWILFQQVRMVPLYIQVWCFLRLVFIASLVVVPYQYYQDYHQRHIEIEFYKLYAEPPVNCGPRAKQMHELDWLQWTAHALWKDSANKECMEFISKMNASPWPNLLDSFSNTFVRLGELPILLVFGGIANGLQNYAKSFIITLLVPAVVFALWRFYNEQPQPKQQQQQPPNYTPKEPSMKELVIKELQDIYKECWGDENFIPPNYEPLNEERAAMIQKELKPLLDMDCKENANNLLIETVE